MTYRIGAEGRVNEAFDEDPYAFAVMHKQGRRTSEWPDYVVNSDGTSQAYTTRLLTTTSTELQCIKAAHLRQTGWGWIASNRLVPGAVVALNGVSVGFPRQSGFGMVVSIVSCNLNDRCVTMFGTMSNTWFTQKNNIKKFDDKHEGTRVAVVTRNGLEVHVESMRIPSAIFCHVPTLAALS